MLILLKKKKDDKVVISINKFQNPGSSFDIQGF